MLMRNISIALTNKGLVFKLFLLFLFLSPIGGYAQRNLIFSKDSIPVVNGEVVFSVIFEYDLDKVEFMKRSVAYLNGKLEPYSGLFLASNRDSTVCRITDYFEVDSNIAQLFAIYATYSLKLNYEKGKCRLTIWDFSYMDKSFFETQEASDRKLNMPEYTGEDMMIKKNYTRLMKKDPSSQVTETTVNRINEIIDNLELTFSRK